MEKPNRGLQILNIASAGLLVVATGLVFLYAPQERTMGEVQRIFYFHVPSAWVSFLAFLATFVAGIAYLRGGNRRWDIVARSSVEVGLLFTVMTIITGSIWARPAWNTWWTWDPRLTTYTIMALIYVAYIMLRQGLEDPERRARFAAVYGIVGFISVPITFMSIRWWRTIHPVVFRVDAIDVDGQMMVALLVALAAFTLLYVYLLKLRVGLEHLQIRVETLQRMRW